MPKLPFQNNLTSLDQILLKNFFLWSVDSLCCLTSLGEKKQIHNEVQSRGFIDSGPTKGLFRNAKRGNGAGSDSSGSQVRPLKDHFFCLLKPHVGHANAAPFRVGWTRHVKIMVKVP